MNRETIKDFYGKVLGFVDTEANGDKIARDFYGKIVGRYKKSSNTTYDFYGKIVARGDAVVGTIYSANNK